MGRAHLLAPGRPVADVAGRPDDRHLVVLGGAGRGDRRSRSSGCSIALVALAARRHDVRLTDPVPEVTVTTSPRSLARAVGHEVRSHADVVSASVVASSNKVVVKAGTLDAPDVVRAAVRERIDALFTRLPLARRPRVSVSVAATKGVK